MPDEKPDEHPHDDDADTLTCDGDHAEEDVFHDELGNPLLADADPLEVVLYAHHCWRLGLDPDATADALRAG